MIKPVSMDVDRSVASASARSSGNFDRGDDANHYAYASTRNGRSGKVSKFKSLFQVDSNTRAVIPVGAHISCIDLLLTFTN